MAGDFSVTVDPYLWKRLKNDDNEKDFKLRETNF
jgi:hypothetical protein